MLSLPAPRNNNKSAIGGDDEDKKIELTPPLVLPGYLKRSGFRPKSSEDYGDGGAYPEIHVKQYPLNMGKPGAKSSSVVAVDTDSSGNVKFDAIAKKGKYGNLTQTGLVDTKELRFSSSQRKEEELAMPDQTEEEITAEKTKLALEALMTGRSRVNNPTAVVKKDQNDEPEATFIRYTPNPDAPGYNPLAAQRVIKVVEAPIDPMEPPKHSLKGMKTAHRPDTEQVPILQEPIKKLTSAENQEWKIPPCVSNWKNDQGYIIPLDKRLAADGRNTTEVTINNKFAGLAEALYVSERKAADDLRVRNSIRKQMAMREKEDKESDLRKLAQQARLDRGGLPINNEGSNQDNDNDYDIDSEYNDATKPDGSSMRQGGGARGVSNLPAWMQEKEKLVDIDDTFSSKNKNEDGVITNSHTDSPEINQEINNTDDSEKVAAQQREKMRTERRKEREKELRQENFKGRAKAEDRNEGRDISEKIALGMHTGGGSGGQGNEALYDSRLFNQSGGISSGFGAEDDYNTYSKPLFDRAEASSLYRPNKSEGDTYGTADQQMDQLKNTSKFKADKGFKGTEGSAGPRSAPVQFETAHDQISTALHTETTDGIKREGDDVFGIDDIVNKKQKR